MQKLSVLALVLVVVVGIVRPVSGQTGAAIPECSQDEIVALSEIVPDYLGRYIEISQAMQTVTGPAEIGELAADLDALQVEWWAEAVPELPRCALAIDTQIAVGRLIDELLLSVLIIGAGYYDLSAGHTAAINDLSFQITELVTEYTE